MAKTIKGNEIIQDNWADNSIQSAEQLKSVINELDKSLLKIIEHGKAVSKSATVGSVAEIKKVTEAYQQTNAATKAAIELDKQLKAADDEVVKGKIRLQEANAEQRKLLKEQIALEDKYIGSLKKAQIENKKLARERDNLNLKTKEGALRLNEINAQIDKNNLLIKQSSDKHKQQILNVGNYKSAISGLNGALTQLGLGLSVFTLMRDAFNTIKDFDKATQSLSAITGATGDDLNKLKANVRDLATTMKISAVDSTKLFEIVGSQMPQLLKDAEGLQVVSESAVTLAKASGDTIESSTIALANVMNQFSLSADEAERTMNVLAAGSLVGSAGITDVSEAMKNFGSVASGANVSVEESVALIEVLGKFGLVGAEAGTKLRGSLLKLQQAGLGYASGQFEINDALEEAKAKFDSLGSALEKDAFLQKTFGAENISTGKILLSNIKLFEEYTAGVTGTSVATDQAAINSNTMSTILQELSAQWDNLVIGLMEGNDSLEIMKSVLRFVTENLGTIFDLVLRGTGAWIAYRGALLLVNKDGTGIIQVLGKITTSLAGAEKGVKGFATAMKSVSFASWIGLLAVVIPMLYDFGKSIYESFNQTTALEKVTEKLNERMTEEHAKMDLLRVKVLDAIGNKSKMKVVIDEINSTYGTTIKNIEDESLMLFQLAKAYKQVNAELERKIKQQLIEEDLTNWFKIQRTAEQELKKLGERTLWNAMTFDLYTASILTSEKEISNLQRELFSLNEEIGESGKSLSDDLSPKMRTITSDSKDAKDAVKDLRTGVDRLVKSTQGFTDTDLKLWRELIELLGGGIKGNEFDPEESLAEMIARVGGDAAKKAQEEQERLEKEAFDRRKKMALDSLALLKRITDAMSNEYDMRIEKEKEAVEASQGTLDYLYERAKLGDADAAASIQAQQAAIDRDKLEIAALEKKKANLIIITSGLEALSQAINNGDSNAFANVGTKMAEFIAKLPKFYKGTEGTVAEALGNPHLGPGRDGYITRLDGKEMVLNGDKVGALRAAGMATTSEVANAALAYSSGLITNRASITPDIMVLSKLNSIDKTLEKGFSNMPEHDVRWDDFNKVLEHTIKTGSKITKNHFKQGGLFS